MNNVINKFLLVGDKFMPEMHLRQPQFVYSACGPFIRHKERIKKFKQTGDTRYIYRNELDKACFQHYSAYADHKNLINRTEADKILRDKAYDIASNSEYDGYQRGLASMVYKFFDKKPTGSGFKKLRNTTKSEVDKIDTDKLQTVPDDLAKLSNVVKKYVFKKTTYNTLKNKIDAIDTSKFVARTKFTTDTNSLDDKIDKVEKKLIV